MNRCKTLTVKGFWSNEAYILNSAYGRLGFQNQLKLAPAKRYRLMFRSRGVNSPFSEWTVN